MSLESLSDMELVAGFSDIVIEARERLVLELEYIGELDRRKLFFEYPSLWSYLVAEHGLEESTAERKIRAARFLRQHPELKRRFECGALNLSLLEIAQGCAHRENLEDAETIELLNAISGMSCRKARREVAARYPRSEELPHDRIRPLTDEFSEVRFVAGQALLDHLDEIRGLLAHSHPSAALAELIGVLAAEYRERHHPEEKARRAAERKAKENEQAHEENTGEEVEGTLIASLSTETVGSPSAPKVIPPEEKRAPSVPLVHDLTLRDGYRCSYVDPRTGKRCDSRHGLEIDHIQSWADGGRTELGNLRYLCRSHHSRVSFLRFGDAARFQGGRLRTLSPKFPLAPRAGRASPEARRPGN